MGIPRPKRLPHNKVARVHPTMCQPDRCPKGIDKAEWKAYINSLPAHREEVPRAILTVKVGNSEERKAVRRMLHNSGCKELQRPELNAILVTGSFDQLNAALAHSCVLRVELTVSARVGGQAQGGGPEKIKASPPRNKVLRPDIGSKVAIANAEVQSLQDLGAFASVSAPLRSKIRKAKTAALDVLEDNQPEKPGKYPAQYDKCQRDHVALEHSRQNNVFGPTVATGGGSLVETTWHNGDKI